MVRRTGPSRRPRGPLRPPRSAWGRDVPDPTAARRATGRPNTACSGRACTTRTAGGPRGSPPMSRFRSRRGGLPRRGTGASPRTPRAGAPMASSQGDAPHRGPRVRSRRVSTRTVRAVARRRVPDVSCGHLPDGALGLEPLALDLLRVLALEPWPERQRDLREWPVADVLSRERILVHLRPEIARVDRHDADAGFS